MSSNFISKFFTPGILLLSLFFIHCAKSLEGEPKTKHKFEVTKSEEEWKKILSPEAYKVLREKGTEGALG